MAAFLEGGKAIDGALMAAGKFVGPSVAIAPQVFFGPDADCIVWIDKQAKLVGEIKVGFVIGRGGKENDFAGVAGQIIADSGPETQVGSKTRTYGALGFLTLVAAYLAASFLDTRAGRRRGWTRRVAAARQPSRRSRYPLNLAKRALRSRRLVLLELRNKLLLWPHAAALRRFENREVARLSAVLAPPEARVAVVITTYRRPELLLAAVRSVLAQSVADLAVVVVDDGGGMLPPFPPDPRLAVCTLSANTGVPGVARNVGIRLTKSEYVAFLDDDNEWETRHLEVALQVLERGDAGKPAGLVYTALRRCLPDGRTHDVLSVEFDRGKLGFDNFVDTNAMVIRRFRGLRWSRIPRSRGVTPAEDWELAYRLSRTVRAEHVNSATVRYRMNPGSHFNDWVVAQ